ncbi:MAG: hypothetical protein Q8936_16905 [Bacillota bacterium]|nr:hypothetical protein [Bacillota bacterium]
MNSVAREHIEIELRKISNDILVWSMGNENFLNVTSMAYNTSEIFIGTIVAFAEKRKRVLYITNEQNVEIIKYIKNNTGFKSFSFFTQDKVYYKDNLIITDYQNAIGLKDKFDLVIYDDIRSYPIYSRYEIIDIMANCSKPNGKLIAYSIEKIFNESREMKLWASEINMPIIEPRVILTRIDIDKDIPYVIFEYLKWSIDLKRNVVVHVPIKEKIKGVFKYLSLYKSKLTNNILWYSTDSEDSTVLEYFQKNKGCIIVTDDFDKISDSCFDLDVLVYVYDDKSIDYKRLVYFSGKVGRIEKRERGEVIFLANEETVEIEKAKSITRSFNKKAWEKGLLSL